MPGNLTNWKRGDKAEHSHLNEAWDRLRQMGAIAGLSQVGQGTAENAPIPTFYYMGCFDGQVVFHNNEKVDPDGCYINQDYPDPRYDISQVHQHQKTTTPQSVTGATAGKVQSDDPQTLEQTPLGGNLPPDRVVMAWNLWENEWNSHYVLPGEIVTVHVIRAVMDKVAGTSSDFQWYVFDRAPKPIRQGTVVNQDRIATPTDCDNVVYVWDQKELVKGEACREITKLKLSTEQLAGAWDIDEYDVLDYIPTKPIISNTAYIPGMTPGIFWAGDVVAWHPVQHVGVFGCKGQTINDVAPIGTIQFFENDFTIAQADIHGTGCFDTAQVKWKGMDVAAYTGLCCGIKSLRFDGTNSAGGGTPYPVNFSVTCQEKDRQCGCPEGGTESVGQAFIAGSVVIPTVPVCVVKCVTQDPSTKNITVSYETVTVLAWQDSCSNSCSSYSPCSSSAYPVTDCSTGAVTYASNDLSAVVGQTVHNDNGCFTIGSQQAVSCSTSMQTFTVGSTYSNCEACVTPMLWQVEHCTSDMFYTDQNLTGYAAFSDGTLCYTVIGQVANTGQTITPFDIIAAYLSCNDCNGFSSSSGSGSGSGGCTMQVWGLTNCLTSITTYTTTDLTAYIDFLILLIDGACYIPSGPFTVACAEEGTYPPVTIDSLYSNCSNCLSGV